MNPPWIIRTPTDFSRSIDGHSYQQHDLARVSPAEEPLVRDLLYRVFVDLPYIEPLDPTELNLMAEGVEEPLSELRDLGVEIHWYRTRGTLHTSSGDVPNWRVVHYLIVNSCGYFGLPGRERLLVHSIADPCPSGWHELAQALLKDTGGIFTWRSMNSVRLTHSLAWHICEHCEARRTAESDPVLHVSSPALALLDKAGWASYLDGVYPRIVHQLLRKASLDLLGNEDKSAALKLAFNEILESQSYTAITTARVVLLLGFERIVETKTLRSFDRTRALALLVLFAKAWGWEIGSSEFRVPTTDVPLRTEDYCARALRELVVPTHVSNALAKMASDEMTFSRNSAPFETLVRAVLDEDSWTGQEKMSADELEDKKWKAVRMLVENPNLKIKGLAAELGIERSHFYRDPKLKAARSLHVKDRDSIPPGRRDARTGQIEGEVVDEVLE